MARRKRAETDSFTVSFLDVASCGFGAMIILLMIVHDMLLNNSHTVEKRSHIALSDYLVASQFTG